jgi:hypothetical protein
MEDFSVDAGPRRLTGAHRAANLASSEPSYSPTGAVRKAPESGNRQSVSKGAFSTADARNAETRDAPGKPERLKTPCGRPS